MRYIATSCALLSLVLMSTACGGSGNKSSTDTPPLSDNDSVSTSSTPATTTHITWIEDRYDFGEIEEGTQVTHGYRFVNNGSAPLLISDASAQCGCTVPQWPKTPIAVGDTAEISVNFNSQNRVGSQNKEISITANTDPSLSILRLRGEVTKDQP